MKTEKSILTAFILNLAFSIFEIIGGLLTGSVAIISDAVHDMGDAVSIGCSYFLEKISKRAPDKSDTYGYLRYSVLGSLISTLILLLGSAFAIYNAILRIIEPVEINYNGMIIFAVIGATVNFFAALFTRHGDSLNQRAVNLHMLEDVLGWLVVLVGAVIMRFTDICIIDPILCIGVAIFIIINAVKNIKVVLDIFLEKTPRDISIDELTHHLLEIKGVTDVHHIHVRSLDGYTHTATLHVVAQGNEDEIKEAVRDELCEHGIAHVTVEMESKDFSCNDRKCSIHTLQTSQHHHHHHKKRVRAKP